MMEWLSHRQESTRLENLLMVATAWFSGFIMCLAAYKAAVWFRDKFKDW